MSTIDHKAEAVDMLTGANPHGSPTEALAHATLYAAEQTAALVKAQEAANVIAWAMDSRRIGLKTPVAVLEFIDAYISGQVQS